MNPKPKENRSHHTFFDVVAKIKHFQFRVIAKQLLFVWKTSKTIAYLGYIYFANYKQTKSAFDFVCLLYISLVFFKTR